MRSLDWNDLRYFLALCRAGTLAAAARDLHVQHSTVGRRLEALEAALAVRLFTRTPDGFVLTEAGAEILPLAEEAERALLAVERRIAGSDDRVEGTVRLTTSEGFSGFLVRRLAQLQGRHPGLMVEVLTANATFDLSRREADLAIRFGATTQGDLVSRHLCDAGWAMYASQGYLTRASAPKAPADLAGVDVVGFDETMAGVPGAVWLEAHKAGARVVIRCNSLISALNATIVGMGVTVLPCFLAEPEPTLRRIGTEVLDSKPICVVFHPDVARTRRVRTVIDFVSALIQREAPILRGERMIEAQPA